MTGVRSTLNTQTRTTVERRIGRLRKGDGVVNWGKKGGGGALGRVPTCQSEVRIKVDNTSGD
jgi:hypothetical protein